MYKIILVDDEAEVRQGMITKVDFESLGFLFAGEAENGVEALEVIELENPDLAIIDIKMPYMDGIELASEIYNKYPAIHVIILSGFDEFEFAQKAIRYNVIDYVLKPVSSKDIVELLQKTKRYLDEEKFKKRDLIQLEKHYLESLPIIKERFLNALVLEQHGIMNLEEKLRRFNINVGEKDFLVAVVRPDKNERIDDDVFDIYAYGVYETCQDLLKNKDVTYFHNHSGDTIIIFNDSSNKAWMHILEEIRAVVEKSHLHTVTIGVGEIVADIIQVSNTYRGAVQALNYKLVEGDNKILWIKDLEPKRLDIIVFDDIEDEMGQLIRSCDINKIEEFLKETLDRFNHISVHIDDIKLFILELMLFLLRISREYNLRIEWFEENKDIYNALEQLSEVTLIQELILNITKEISIGILDTRKNSVKLLVESSEVYINEHYCEDISLESVADFLHISPEYLSRQFKKEKQITFIHYLTSTRLEAAKRLIQDTNKKNFEVAEVVGYKEPNYFSYVFKKHFGISPSKYRKSIKGDL